MAILINKDIIIFGGGIAGLWLLNRLRTEGYDAILFEQDELGKGQSIVSQGMIHGGIKYALSGVLNSASAAIADMPAYWRACLSGKGDIDLKATKILSEHYYLLPQNNIRSRFNAFMGSKAVRGKVDTLTKKDFPAFFQGHISGALYQLNDIVLDVPSLLKNLFENQSQHIYKINWHNSELINDNAGTIQHLLLGNDNHEPIKIQAQRYFFTSGAGTQKLLSNIRLLEPHLFAMQLRPLQMVIVKHQISDPVFVHCVASQLTTTLDLTITSHQCDDGDWVWYLGGALAESGVDRTPEQQIDAAKLKLKQLFPWCDLAKASWKTLFVDRAEAKQDNGQRPEHASLIAQQNICVCWPTKLTLAPNLANIALQQLKQAEVLPGKFQNMAGLSHLLKPTIASTPWHEM